MFKIYQGMYKSIKDINSNIPDDMMFNSKSVDETINKIELGLTDNINVEVALTISSIEDEINKILDNTNKNHCVLLLDDAAHAFSNEQQRDFFDFFRQIKSRIISPKAAIYPGITNFSSTFHVGHDAEEINVWIKPEGEKYINFMMELLKKRLPNEVYNSLLGNVDLLEIMCYSCFGIPRALLNTVNFLYKDKSDDEDELYEVTYNRKSVLESINMVFKQSFDIFTSLKEKLFIYEKFITTGEEIYIKMVDDIKEYNKDKSPDFQSITIAIKKPIPAELVKVFNFYQYAGLAMHDKDINKGEKGAFELYNIHYAALIERNAFLSKMNITTAELALCVRKRDSHAYKRTTPNVLVGSDDFSSVLPLSLPPCQVCGSPRISEHSMFCSQCGAQLKTASIFEELVGNDISKLPLTEKRVDSIKKNSKIKTVKDILMDTEYRELRNVPQVGPYWAKKIYSYAEEYIV